MNRRVARFFSLVTILALLASGVPVSAAQTGAESARQIWRIPERRPVVGPLDLTAIPKVDSQGNPILFPVDDLADMRILLNGQTVRAFPLDAYSSWGWWRINAGTIWPDQTPSPWICLLDTGVDAEHPDLRNVVTPGWDFVNDDNLPEDDNGHGTFVAGILAARIDNQVDSAIGLSIGRVLAVKVLNAQGWGSSVDIAAGIRACAENDAVRVISLNFVGATADPLIYEALAYAITEQGKLVIAPAGYDSSSAQTYPAAWADPDTCADGTLAMARPCPSGQANTIHSGLIAVAGARYTDGTDATATWVDLNSSSRPEAGEYFSDCMLPYSNYGSWVQLVAPGESIFSTVPVSNPYWMRTYAGADPEGDGYDTWSGVSLAAAYAAGAAGRAWNIYPAATNASIKQVLIDSGQALATNFDASAIEPAEGYNDEGYLGDAPFCWPDDSRGGQYSMDDARYLDLAAAMNRAMVVVYVTEATTGLPLLDTRVTLTRANTNTVVAISVLRGVRNPAVLLLNVPVGQTYETRVVRTSSITSPVMVGAVEVDTPGLIFNPFLNVAVPPTGRMTAVITWGGLDGNSDLDLYTFLPTESGPGGVVGFGASGHPDDVGSGDLAGHPFALWNRNGGNDLLGDGFGMESVGLTYQPGTMAPYYNRVSADRYVFFVTDYGSGALDANTVVFRLWNNGGITYTVVKLDTCAAGEDWWQVGTLMFTTLTETNVCGTQDLWP
ncbi:MAG: S8 family serine peptidase [Anaerolineales bacterium]|nr:S8 family serine peptidase [Anaerolineales bacterium]